MMEAARMIALSGAKPKRTILFVAFAGEEFGDVYKRQLYTWLYG